MNGRKKRVIERNELIAELGTNDRSGMLQQVKNSMYSKAMMLLYILSALTTKNPFRHSLKSLNFWGHYIFL